MSGSERNLDKNRIEQLLRELGARLNALGLYAEMSILGGSAVALVFDASRSTADIDAIFQPRDIVFDEAAAMAEELGLAPDWLNDSVSFYLPRVPDPAPRVLAEWPGLTVSTPSPEYLLAMKALVTRKSPADLQDAAVICQHLGLFDELKIEKVAREFYPTGSFGAQELWFEDIAYRAQQLRDSDN